jgi:Protein of unknown function (DUF1353)
MSRFTDALIVSPLADGKTWVTMRDFGYEREPYGSGSLIDVPIGFQTDYASVPRLLWTFFPPWGRYGNAAVIHDWLYWKQELNALPIEHRDADSIFDEAMGVLGVDRFSRWCLFHAVLWFGGFAWLRNEEDRDQGFDRVLPNVQLKAIQRPTRRRAVGQVARALWRKVAG